MKMQIIFILIILCYLGSALAISARLFLDRVRIHSRAVGLALGTCGVLLQSVLIYQMVVTPAGINLGFFSALNLAAWTVVAMLLLESITKPVENLGIVVFPVGALIMCLERNFPTVHFISPSMAWGLKIHIIVSFLAYSFLTLASVQAILLAIQDRHLHARHPGGFIRSLPPLQTMENLLFEMIGLGFMLLSLSLISGFVFLENMFTQHLAHKTILSVFGWFIFGTLLLGRYRAGWRGRTAIVWTLSGFLVLMLAYFGSKAVLELILHRNH